LELSKRQLQIWEEAISDDKMEQIPEGGEDDSSAREKGLDISNGEKVIFNPHVLSLKNGPVPCESSGNVGQDSTVEENEPIVPEENAVNSICEADGNPKDDYVNGDRIKPTK
jgi:hypothetical protein